MVTVTPASDVSRHEWLPGRRAVRVWLYVVALLIVAMVFVGGATRLTGSGLSITEWQPIHGVIPPLGDADWQQEFAKYREIPEYTIVNRGMTLGEFKAIFWWEWAHRLLGRAIGAVFLLPLVFFAATGRIGRSLAPKLVAIFLLGGIQGAVGWWMVASGLSERTDVSQYRLAVHLTLACAILAYVLWVARGLGDRFLRVPASARSLAAVIVAIVFLQIFLGAIVAGLDAGLVSSTWPTMDGAFVPDGLFLDQPWWRNIFENPLTAQFDHRLVAYLLFVVSTRPRDPGAPERRGGRGDRLVCGRPGAGRPRRRGHSERGTDPDCAPPPAWRDRRAVAGGAPSPLPRLGRTDGATGHQGGRLRWIASRPPPT